MKTKPKRSWKEFRSSPFFKVDMLLIFSGVLLAALMVTAGIFLWKQHAPADRETVAAAEPAPEIVAVTPSPSAALPPSPSPTPTPAAGLIFTQLTARSSERDLYAQVCDKNGEPISGGVFTLRFDYPSGEYCCFETEGNAGYYVVDLDEGDYTVSMLETEGYLTAEPVTCHVRPKMAYEVIENIEEIVEVTAVEEVMDEVSVSNDDAVTAVFEPEVEIIETVPEAEDPAPVATEIPVLDEHGNQVYTYQYRTGGSGCLLSADGSRETDVTPIEENGKLAYGLRRVITVFYSDGTVTHQMPDSSVDPSSYNIEESAEYVTLFDALGLPVGDYAITAEPLYETVTALSGWQNIDGNIYYYHRGEPVTGLKNIDGRVYFFDPEGVRCGTLGVDVSFYNEYINWYAVKEAGVDFALIRIGGRGYGSGKLYDDTRFAENISRARAAGLRVGVYFYSSAVNTNEAVEEASVALDRLGGIALDLPIFIDMEYSDTYPEGRADKLTAEERTEIVRAFCTTIDTGGYSAGVYASQSYFHGALNYSSLSGYTVWLANYTDNCRYPSFSGRYDIWQMTSAGSVPGISGSVDMNVIF